MSNWLLTWMSGFALGMLAVIIGAPNASIEDFEREAASVTMKYCKTADYRTTEAVSGNTRARIIVCRAFKQGYFVSGEKTLEQLEGIEIQTPQTK